MCCCEDKVELSNLQMLGESCRPKLAATGRYSGHCQQRDQLQQTKAMTVGYESIVITWAECTMIRHSMLSSKASRLDRVESMCANNPF